MTIRSFKGLLLTLFFCISNGITMQSAHANPLAQAAKAAAFGALTTIATTVSIIYVTQQFKSTKDWWILAPIGGLGMTTTGLALAKYAKNIPATPAGARRFLAGSLAGTIFFFTPPILIPNTMTLGN